MTAFLFATLSLAAAPFDFDAEGRAVPLNPTQFALLYDEAGNTRNPATPPERAAARRAALERIEVRKPKMKRADAKLALEQSDDLLAVGKAADAVELLRPFGREREPDFRLMANLALANAQLGEWQTAMITGSLLRDLTAPDAPPSAKWRANLDTTYRPIWIRYQRDLARDKPDPAGLKPILFFKPGALPPDAVAIVQQLALDAPNDQFLLWALAETTAQAGDFRTAEQLFNRCANGGLTQPKELMARRAEVQDIVEKMPKSSDDALNLSVEVQPPRPPKGLFDLVEPVKFFVLSGAFVLVAVVLLVLQVRTRRRKWRKT